MSEAEFVQPLAEQFGDAATRERIRLPSVAAIVALVGVLLCIGAVTMVAATVPSDAAFGRGLVEFLIVGTPIAAGLYALRIGANGKFAFALIWVGSAWSLTALAESSLSIPYTIGRLSTWLIFPSVVYLLLAFPTGRISKGLDRVLFVGVVAVSVVFFYGTAPLVPAYPPHTLWATCTTDCPANAVAVVDTPPAFLSKLILWREWLVMLLWAGLFWSMFRRFRVASPLQRRAIAPVFAIASVLGVLHISFHAAREMGAPAQTVVDLSSAWTLAIVGVCAAFLFGLFWRRMLLGRAFARLAASLRETDSPAQVRDALATALGDPSVELLFKESLSHAWHDALGRSRTWPRPLSPGRAATVLAGRDAPGEAVLVHDIALRDDEELLEGVSGIVVASWRHERLASELAQATTDLEQSRRRIAEASTLERARIERDLHDGAQQRLIALQIKLGLAEERLQTDPTTGARELRELGVEVERALDELRSLAHGVYPSVLNDLGLVAALRTVQRQQASTLPIHVTATGTGRHPIEVESAVYFTCLEAVQNAMKHATGAAGVWIRLEETCNGLHFEVRDDGPGIRLDALPGQGLQNMRDRIEAIGGSLTVDGRPGHGTRIAGTVKPAPA